MILIKSRYSCLEISKSSIGTNLFNLKHPVEPWEPPSQFSLNDPSIKCGITQEKPAPTSKYSYFWHHNEWSQCGSRFTFLCLFFESINTDGFDDYVRTTVKARKKMSYHKMKFLINVAMHSFVLYGLYFISHSRDGPTNVAWWHRLGQCNLCHWPIDNESQRGDYA